MAEIGVQRADVLVEVHPGARPPDQGVDGKALSLIMYAPAHGSGANADADLPERLVYAVAGESGADAAEEEGSRARPWTEAVTLGRVATQRFGGCRVQRHQPGGVELRLPDRDDTGHRVDVVALETNPHRSCQRDEQ